MNNFIIEFNWTFYNILSIFFQSINSVFWMTLLAAFSYAFIKPFLPSLPPLIFLTMIIAD